MAEEETGEQVSGGQVKPEVVALASNCSGQEAETGGIDGERPAWGTDFPEPQATSVCYLHHMFAT